MHVYLAIQSRGTEFSPLLQVHDNKLLVQITPKLDSNTIVVYRNYLIINVHILFYILFFSLSGPENMGIGTQSIWIS